VNWTRGGSGVPTNWELYNDTSVEVPIISFNGFETITLSCETEGASILYKLNNIGEYSTYTSPIIINEDTFIEAYATYSGETSRTISQTCQYVSSVPIEYSNRDLKKWQYGGQEITTPYSVNAIDGHSSSYAKGTFNFETSFALSGTQPTYLWFQHADQSAEIYVDNTMVEKHWGGYAAFTSDISEYVHGGINNIKVSIKNNEGNNLAPASADFNFNATLGNVRLLTSPYLPRINYGYDGFHISSTVSDAEATIYIKTSVPTGATLVCTIDDGNTNIYSATSASTGEEMTFTKVIANPHLWNGKSDPYMYTVTLEIYGGNDLYHRFVRPYGLRYYEYVINDTEKVGTAGNPYTGFLLNGSPYLLRGVCMHDDIVNKANALNDTDYDNTFATIQELGCNFIRLAHYPHPKEVYDRCDALGIVVQTEGPCVNKLQSTMPEQYYTHLTGQYTDMVNQHYNHPCIFFWGLSNETSTDDKAFAKEKIEGYASLIKSLDSERMVGYVLAQGTGQSPSAYYNDPSNIDWFGCNIYVGWYDSPNSNTPTGQINTRLANTIGRVGKPMAYSEYGCGGTQACHSDDYLTTTTRGNNPRHDIEYMMWLHEGHIATIKQYPQLLYTSQWQLFDIAVSSRNEGYTVCLDGVNTSTDDSLRRLNNKGLVERDHVTKKDTFYLYKAWWNTADTFVHICGKNYEKIDDRVIKCYTNVTGTLTMYVNGTSADTATVTNNIVEFAVRDFTSGDVVSVSGSNVGDSFTISGTTDEHNYVEIAGTKWATMNVGASTPTDYGLYFQWGDTSGYTIDQIGSGQGKKYFGGSDYKYSSGGKIETSMVKYNTSDNLTTLEDSDDGAKAYWGNDWRIPTKDEYDALLNATTTAWTSNYQGSGVSGYVLTDKTDSTKKLFFPAAGEANQGVNNLVGSFGEYWSKTRYTQCNLAWILETSYSSTFGRYTRVDSGIRVYGISIRPVKDA
jgi:beta-galactosidase